MSSVILTTTRGVITLILRADVAPVTAQHAATVMAKVFAGATFYRSDFVIQCGLHGTAKVSPLPNLAVNESTRAGALSNTRGAVAVAHWDKPDCGNSEFFISLQDNLHLDTAFGGYCVFATVRVDDAVSWRTIDAIAAAIPTGEKPVIEKVEIA